MDVSQVLVAFAPLMCTHAVHQTCTHAAPCPVQAASLKRYRQVYQLAEADPDSTKEELLHAVSHHFASQVRWLSNNQLQGLRIRAQRSDIYVCTY